MRRIFSIQCGPPKCRLQTQWQLLPLRPAAILIAWLIASARRQDWWRRRNPERAMEQFRHQREYLEARFFDLVASLGKPRDLIWLECDWQPEVTFAWNRGNGLLTAFAAVNIRFDAVEGGDMEDVEAVSTIRDAAAVFHYHRGRWGTGGRALFNMNPPSGRSGPAGRTIRTGCCDRSRPIRAIQCVRDPDQRRSGEWRVLWPDWQQFGLSLHSRSLATPRLQRQRGSLDVTSRLSRSVRND